MSADFRTEHFKGWQHDGYVHVVTVDADGHEYQPANFTAAEVAELASMFPELRLFTRDQLIDAISRLEAYPATLKDGRVVIIADSMADAIIEALEGNERG